MKILILGCHTIAGQSVLQYFTSHTDVSEHQIYISKENGHENYLTGTSGDHVTLIDLNPLSLSPISKVQNGHQSLAHFLQLNTVEVVILFLPVDDFPDHYKALEYGNDVIEACKASTSLKHIIFSTNASPLVTLGIECKYFDWPSQVETLIRQSNIHATFLMLPLLYQDFLHFLKPSKTGAKKYKLFIPTGQVAVDWLNCDDVGPIVQRVLSKPTHFYGKTLALSAGKLTGKDVTGFFNEALAPNDFMYSQVSFEEMRKMDRPNALYWGNRFEFLVRVDQKYNVELTRSHHSQITSLREWLFQKREFLLNALIEDEKKI